MKDSASYSHVNVLWTIFKEDVLKGLESSIITVKSEIEKNKTALKDAIKYKNFLTNLDAEHAEIKKREKEEAKQDFKAKWI